MKRYFTSLSILFFGLSSILAQLSDGGTPESFTNNNLKSSSNYIRHSFLKVDIQNQLEHDKKEGIKNRYAVYENVKLDLKNKEGLFQISNGNVWRTRIDAENAYSISVIFSNFKIPQGAKLFVYSLDNNIIRGAYTYKNNKENGIFALADFPGDAIILEYFEPFDPDFKGSLIIGKIGKAYRDLGEIDLKATTEDNINVTCPEGYPYQTEKHAVAKMTFQEGNSGYLCTGALINNARNDGKPYFLTANHCLSKEIVANTLVTYFNYERLNCTGIYNQQQTLSGSVLKSTNAATDFTLLELSEVPPSDYRPFYAGWNAASDDYVISGYGIHHPQGEDKKIAVSHDSIRSWDFNISWQDGIESEPNTHWLVLFNAGFTLGGSSGSPLFDNNNRIIGQLHGGGDGADFYGKLSRSWNLGTLANGKIKPFLDPDNTGTLVMEGYYPPEVIPEPFFLADITSVCEDAAISLKNGSAFNITNYKWQFNPGSVQYLNGTSDTSKYPIVAFEESLNYSVSLKVSNQNGSDSTTRKNYISSGNVIKPLIKSITDTLDCLDVFDELVFYGVGADSFSFSILEGEEFIDPLFSDNGDTLTLLRKEGLVSETTLHIDIQLKGYQGACADSVVQRIYLIVPENDFVANAMMLNMGENGPFDNYCATVEENEPHPVIGACATLGEWCDCEIGAPYLDNSVWFTFIAPATGVIGIDCPGFDNQIAIYEAATAEDIVSGNPLLYTIVAANDDYDEISIFAARIDNISLISGKKYWLQVDGSACGAYGEFNVKLVDGGIVSINDVDNFDLRVYPNPVNSSFTISGNLGNDIFVTILSIDGKVVADYHINNITQNNEHTFTLPQSLKSGVYLLKVSDGKSITNMKLSVVH
ncbi:MAG: T9SS type A sorting domain-containing protein [Bacteroidota bacterium]|nr:MAG: T9SS type A sorting domain-containing protein [Bacteroidota bacterium]